MAEFHRRIELQSPDDLQYLIANVRRAANEKIDKDLPPIEGDDPIRRGVEQLVHEFITRVFLSASQNITINGLDPTPDLITSSTSNSRSNSRTIEEHEPFDSKLFERLKYLARQEEDLVEEIAALRRNNPGIAVERAKKAYKEGMERDEEELGKMEEVLKGEGEKESVLGVGRLERQEDVEGNWRKGVEGLERLKRTLPETVAKKERAERAENYVVQPERK